jgi:flagellar biosynthesis protein FliQ
MNSTNISQELYSSAMSIAVLAGPVLAIAGLTGLVVGLLQAVTQIQDQTLGQILKLFVVSLVLLFMGARLSTPLLNHSETLFKNFHLIVK